MWWRRQLTNHAPLARCAHGADSVDGKLYVFGGWSEDRLFNDLHVYTPDNQTWSKLQDDKIEPRLVPISGHSTTAVGKKICVFGGSSANETSSNIFLNDVLFFDTESGRWQQARTTGVSPTGRTKHTATLIGSKLYVFGGGDVGRLHNDLYCLNLDSMIWELPSCKGTPPCPRWGHTTVQVGKLLVVFGGHDGMNRLDDVHVFDTDTNTWRYEACTRRTPQEIVSPCAGHTATMVGPHMLVIGGGDGHVLPAMYALDTLTWQWWWAGNAPGICAHTTTLVGTKLIAFGGGDGAYCFNDLYAFDADKLEELYKSGPPNLKLQSSSKHPPVQPAPLSTSPPKNVRAFVRSPRGHTAPSLTSTFTPSITTHTPSSSAVPPRSTFTPSSSISSSASSFVSSASPFIPASASHNFPTPAPPTPSLPATSPSSVTTPHSPPPPATTTRIPSLSVNIPANGTATSNGGTLSGSAEGINSRSSVPHGSPVKSRRNSKPRSNNATPTGTPTTTPPASPRDQIRDQNSAGGNVKSINGIGNGEQQPQQRTRRNSRARDKPPNLAKWLQGLGMSKYLDKFLAEEIDIDILDMLNEGHFKLLGIPLGDRLRLVAAVSRLPEFYKTV